MTTLETATALEGYAEQFATTLEFGAVLILTGAMGAGKTTFVKGLARGLKASVAVSSPTYTYIHEYPTPQGRLIHIDAYRLETAKKLWQMGLAEYLETAQVIVIEWGKDLLEDIPEAKHLQIEILESGRQITLL